MKKLSKILLVLLCISEYAIAQNSYYVLNARGTVKVKKTGAVVKVNDQISDKDVLLFSSPNDALAVISTKNGRMILKPKPTAKSSELVCVVSEILNPGTGRLSARAGKINNVIELKKYFGEDSLLILGTSRVWISPSAFIMDASNFFFVRYTLNGETINKKLSFDKDSLILNAAEIYKVDGKSVLASEVKEAKLFYKSAATASELCPFTIRFAEEESAKATVSSFKKNSSSKGDEFLQELYPLLKDIYGGNTDKENVRLWVLKNIGPY